MLFSRTISSTGSKNSTNYAINNSATKSSLTINNTNANIKSDYSGSVCNYGAITMSNGKILSTYDTAISQYSGNTTITGGEVTGNFGITPKNQTSVGSGEITIGTNDSGTPSTTSPIITGGEFSITPANYFSQIYFYDGKITISYKDHVIYGATPINPKPGDSSYKNQIKTPTGYSILLSSDGATATLGKVTSITDTSKIKSGIVINYPTLSNSVSISSTTYSGCLKTSQTFSTSSGKVKCVVIRNSNGNIDIVPLTASNLVTNGRMFYVEKLEEILDKIASIYNNSSYSVSSYNVGSSKRTNYTTEEDTKAIYDAYKTNTTNFSSLYYDDFYGYWTSMVKDMGNAYYNDVYVYFGTKTNYQNKDDYITNVTVDSEETQYYPESITSRIMPVISLKNTVTITGGSGTYANPYELGT